MKHTEIDRTPYTYLITHPETGLRYYGCRYGHNCHPSDLWVTYFTSSDYVKDMILKYGVDSFKFEIRKIFSCQIKCRTWESRVLSKIYKSEKYINRNYGGDHFSKQKSGKDNILYGIPNEKVSIRMRNNNPMKNPEYARRMANKRIQNFKLGVEKPRNLSESEKSNISTRMISNNPMHDPNHISKMVDTMRSKYGGGNVSYNTTWMANTITKIRKRVHKNEVDSYLQIEGWIKLSNRIKIPD